MGKMKDLLIREEESAMRGTNSAVARVSGGGGDIMQHAIEPAVESRFQAALAGATGQPANVNYEEERRDVELHDQDPSSEPPDDLERLRAEARQSQIDAGILAPTPIRGVIVGGVSTQKVHHDKLILEGVCTHCAHCALKLTDSESVERGIGPVCSKRGYFEAPKDGDEMQAMIDLAEYPLLVDFLTTHYKPQGIRAMVNGLVRVCSLNRKSEVHQACTDAIESLGYKKLASLLRESLACVQIRPSKEHPGSVEIWVKKAEWKISFTNALRDMPGAFFSKELRATVVPMTKTVEDLATEGGLKEVPIVSYSYLARCDLTHKKIVRNLLLRHYENYFMKTDQGVIRINKKSFGM